MATNWNAILSNANSLNDILMILRKVLAGLDAKADVTLIDEALDDIGNLKIDVDGAIDTINQAILDFENTGGYITAANFSELNLITPSYDFQLARAEDTGDEYRWDTSASPSPAWIPTGRNYLQDAINFANTNAVFKPLLNPAEKNQNNVGYSVAYYSVAADITLANNFPVASTPTFVLTYKLSGTSVIYQRAILPFVSPIRAFERSNTGSWSVWAEGTNKAAMDALTTIVNNNAANEKAFESKVFSQTGKNKLDKSKIVNGEYFSPGSGTITVSASYKRSDFIPVVAGTRYYLSGTSTGATDIAWFAAADKTTTAISSVNARTGIAPAGANFAVVNITHDGTTNFNNTAQFEIGTVGTSYEAYKPYINSDDIYDLMYYDSFNKVDISKVDFTKRYSNGSKTIIPADTNLIAKTDWIPVKEGQFYVVDGSAHYSPNAPQGGYFSSYGATTAVDNITWAAPPTGSGKIFQVPTGLGITHVVLSLITNADHTAVNGIVQMEAGEVATAYQPYNAKRMIKPDLLPESSGSSGGGSVVFNDGAWFKYTKADSPTIYPDKLPNFRKHMLLKDKDLVVVMTGTSLTARTTEHCSSHPNASLRPPMMHSLAFCSHIWDAIKWEGQQYRRYDATGFFTQTGTFTTTNAATEWDDGAYRDGLTRYSSDVNAAVQFTVPIDAWQFNFIYRTDSVGTTDAKVVIAEGDGKIQVLNDAGTWVEANNYIFSMLEATPVTRTVAIPSVISETTTNTTLASKGNTTYQKRLKMRCRSDDGSLDSRASTKAVTISNNAGSGRFLYWGVEWSPRQFMITYINSSRGSHNTSATSATGLPRYQDNEIWSFKPDLILSELAIHNDGAAAAAVYPVGYWKQLAKHYVTNTSYELSLYSRAAYFGQTPEYAFFMGTITWNFGGINDDGTLKFGLQSSSSFGSGKAMTALDKYQEAVDYLRSQNIVALATAQRWVDAGNGIFGGMKDATVGSGKNGATFTNEGSHWNDTGSMIIAKAVIPLVK